MIVAGALTTMARLANNRWRPGQANESVMFAGAFGLPPLVGVRPSEAPVASCARADDRPPVSFVPRKARFVSASLHHQSRSPADSGPNFRSRDEQPDCFCLGPHADRRTRPMLTNGVPAS